MTIEVDTTEVLDRYECVLALDPRWSGPWVALAEGEPAVASTFRTFEDPACGGAFVFVPGAVDLNGVARFLSRVDATGQGGPYGGLAVVHDRCVFRTNWELVEASEWRFVLDRLRSVDAPQFIETFGTTGMELEFTRRGDVLVIQHVDHEQVGGVPGSRRLLPRIVLRDPVRFANGVERVVSLIDALDARCGYWTGTATA